MTVILFFLITYLRHSETTEDFDDQEGISKRSWTEITKLGKIFAQVQAEELEKTQGAKEEKY